MRAQQVPGGSILNVVEAFASPYAQARGMVATVPHPTEGSVRIASSPLRLSDTPVRPPSAPPTLGQHTDEVLRERLQFSDERIAALHAAKAVG